MITSDKHMYVEKIVQKIFKKKISKYKSCLSAH